MCGTDIFKPPRFDNFTPPLTAVELLPYSTSFQVKHLSQNTAEKISEKIYHGIPLGRSEKVEGKTN